MPKTAPPPPLLLLLLLIEYEYDIFDLLF